MAYLRTFLGLFLVRCVAKPLRFLSELFILLHRIPLKMAEWLMTEEQRANYERLKEEARS